MRGSWALSCRTKARVSGGALHCVPGPACLSGCERACLRCRGGGRTTAQLRTYHFPPGALLVLLHADEFEGRRQGKHGQRDQAGKRGPGDAGEELLCLLSWPD